MDPNHPTEFDLSAARSFPLSPRAQRYLPFKRFFDLFFAVIILLVAAIPCGGIVLLIMTTSRGPAVFSQKRIGRNGHPFSCYKFRTMYADAPKYCATPDFQEAEKYITPIGKILRKTSLDELPQLINVLKGDMSFIGPRPLIPEEKDIHEERLKRGIYTIRPGISGLAQINGRDRVDAETKVAFDEQYLRDLSLLIDVKIVFGTFFGVLTGNDIVEGK